MLSTVVHCSFCSFCKACSNHTKRLGTLTLWCMLKEQHALNLRTLPHFLLFYRAYVMAINFIMCATKVMSVKMCTSTDKEQAKARFILTGVYIGALLRPQTQPQPKFFSSHFLKRIVRCFVRTCGLQTCPLQFYK